jgi:hypothetical protein
LASLAATDPENTGMAMSHDALADRPRILVRLAARPVPVPVAVAEGDGDGDPLGRSLIEIEGTPGLSVGAPVGIGEAGVVTTPVGALDALAGPAPEPPPGSSEQPASTVDTTTATGARPDRPGQELLDMRPVLRS